METAIDSYKLPFTALPDDPLIVAKVEAVTGILRSVLFVIRHSVSQNQLQGRQENLEPAIFNLAWIKHRIIGSSFAAVYPPCN